MKKFIHFLVITLISGNIFLLSGMDLRSQESGNYSGQWVAPAPLNRIDLKKIPGKTLPVQQISPISAVQQNEISQIIEQGQGFIQASDWFSARSLFEKALKKYPDDIRLHRAFAKARCHFEIGLRYSDPSYRDYLNGTSFDDAMYLFDEIFANVQDYHVDTPNWNELFLFGMNGLEVSFSDPVFLRGNNIDSEYSPRFQQYFTSLRRQTDNWSINSLNDLRKSIQVVAHRIKEDTGISDVAIIMEFVSDIICSLDTYSAYLTAGQINDVYSMIDGHFVGLGVELKAENGDLTIVRIIPHSPAAESGLQVGDRILAVDGVPTSGPNGVDMSGSMLQGEEGSVATLTIRRTDDEIREVSVTRRQINVPSVENVQVIDNKNNQRIGYVKILCFQKTTAAELSSAMKYLSRLRMECLIIDLRQNPGGLLQEAIDTTNLFIDQGTIVRTRGRNNEQSYLANHHETWKVPLIVLIDENSASASEIFAGAIRDNRRGCIIGTNSYGKGTVQAIIQLSGRNPVQGGRPIAGLRLTTEKFYSPKGLPYSGIGVSPDINIAENEDSPNDAQEYRVSRPADGESDASPQKEIDYCLNRALDETERILANSPQLSNAYTVPASQF